MGRTVAVWQRRGRGGWVLKTHAPLSFLTCRCRHSLSLLLPRNHCSAPDQNQVQALVPVEVARQRQAAAGSAPPQPEGDRCCSSGRQLGGAQAEGRVAAANRQQHPAVLHTQGHNKAWLRWTSPPLRCQHDAESTSNGLRPPNTTSNKCNPPAPGWRPPGLGRQCAA